MQEIWGLPKGEYSWAAAGYMGAIMSGQTVCGTLIGAATAIGLKCGEGREGTPEENGSERACAIEAVGKLYRDFIDEFGSTDCATLCHCDFTNADDAMKYIQTKGWKGSCDLFLEFVMKSCAMMNEGGTI
ncbi:MAG: C_GCAxxG_C_C family protein [Deltaproteobacteria bacterium]|nr:C_GCAxxG_C_C family protein [Deltaproteobacteria bacterium]